MAATPPPRAGGVRKYTPPPPVGAKKSAIPTGSAPQNTLSIEEQEEQEAMMEAAQRKARIEAATTTVSLEEEEEREARMEAARRKARVEAPVQAREQIEQAKNRLQERVVNQREANNRVRGTVAGQWEHKLLEELRYAEPDDVLAQALRRATLRSAQLGVSAGPESEPEQSDMEQVRGAAEVHLMNRREQADDQLRTAENMVSTAKMEAEARAAARSQSGSQSRAQEEDGSVPTMTATEVVQAERQQREASYALRRAQLLKSYGGERTRQAAEQQQEDRQEASAPAVQAQAQSLDPVAPGSKEAQERQSCRQDRAQQYHERMKKLFPKIHDDSFSSPAGVEEASSEGSSTASRLKKRIAAWGEKHTAENKAERDLMEQHGLDIKRDKIRAERAKKQAEREARDRQRELERQELQARLRREQSQFEREREQEKGELFARKQRRHQDQMKERLDEREREAESSRQRWAEEDDVRRKREEQRKKERIEQEYQREQQKKRQQERRERLGNFGRVRSPVGSVSNKANMEQRDNSKWEAFESALTPNKLVSFKDVPFPEMGRFLSISVPEFKKLAKRWHPDKFAQMYGARLCPVEKDMIMQRVKATFQALNDAR
eukprot:TRINITY_DN21899_c0_g1_i1.p1 TRINITY_DN21899_c0_g1~~TRINITY_DN21899_c0_g1_i1.p1  ORF type:complete len:608 (-),score=183.25 TRINITY_DN21899_c0_g1_i1:139-1962(-)